jgi:hypothetical protein
MPTDQRQSGGIYRQPESLTKTNDCVNSDNVGCDWLVRELVEHSHGAVKARNRASAVRLLCSTLKVSCNQIVPSDYYFDLCTIHVNKSSHRATGSRPALPLCSCNAASRLVRHTRLVSPTDTFKESTTVHKH